VFVENHAPAAKLIRENLASLKIVSGAEVIAANAVERIAKLASHPRVFDFVYLDPPYAAVEEYEASLVALGDSPLVSPSYVVIAEHSKKFDLPEIVGRFRRYRILKQGDAALSFFRLPDAER
jgi:16S rRNA G966 N2-methylase RsmD